MLQYYVLYALVWLITLLPLRFLYVFADIAYPIVYYIARYRVKVTRGNLQNSFPEKSKAELRSLERKFYRYFCDVFVETLYEMNIRLDEAQRRMTFHNLEPVFEQLRQNKSVMIMTAHYGNWEWMNSFCPQLPAEYQSFHSYKKIRNERMDKLVKKLRGIFGATLLEKKELLRAMVRQNKEKEIGCYWMISDQTPNGHSVHYWTNFLNQDTAAITGTEVLARKFDYPVFYAEVMRIRRGYYQCTFLPVEMSPKAAPEFSITERYMRLLEETIQKQPETWLWSHKRWKHSH